MKLGSLLIDLYSTVMTETKEAQAAAQLMENLDRRAFVLSKRVEWDEKVVQILEELRGSFVGYEYALFLVERTPQQRQAGGKRSRTDSDEPVKPAKKRKVISGQQKSLQSSKASPEVEL